MLNIPITTRIDDKDTEVVVRIRKMRAYRNGSGETKVVLDDFDALAADGTTVLELDEVEIETVPYAVEELLEATLDIQTTFLAGAA